MEVRQAYERSILGIDAADSLKAAAARMYDHAVGSLAVYSESEIVGIITERDVVRAASVDVDLATHPVADFMTSGIVTVPPEYNVGEAAAMMVRLGVRHLPVVDETGQMLGMLSARDLMSVIKEVPQSDSRFGGRPRLSIAPRTKEVVLDDAQVGRLRSGELDGNAGVSFTTLWRDPRNHSTAGVMRLEPGAVMRAHTHQYSTHHVWIAEGECTVAGKVLSRGSYCFVPAGVEHSIDRAGDDGCTLFCLYERAVLD